jgi:predicted acetyltransferase
LDRLGEVQELEELIWAERWLTSSRQRFGAKLDFGRTFGVEAPDGIVPRGARLAAMASAWAFDTLVPGGRVAAGGLTHVGVRPGCQRRGYLRALVAAHFEDCLARGEPISMLFASEMPIYGRFGYGLASRAAILRLRRGAALRPSGLERLPVSVEPASFETHGPVVDQIAQEVGDSPAARPGWVADATEGMRRERFADNEPADTLLEPLRMALAWRDGRPRGYALFRREVKWHDAVPDGTARVAVFEAAEPAAAHSLWAELAGLPLVGTVETPLLALDDPLFAWLEDWRAAHPTIVDAQHVRILDLAAALTARTYAQPLDLRIAVDDPLLEANSGVWRLVGGPDGAEVERVGEAAGRDRTGSDASGEADSDKAGGAVQPSESTDNADVALDIRELGALYFGAWRPAAFADAGLVRERTPGAALALGRAFAADREPATPRGF